MLLLILKINGNLWMEEVTDSQQKTPEVRGFLLHVDVGYFNPSLPFTSPRISSDS